MERITSIQKIEHADGSSHEQIYCFGHLWGPAFFKNGTKDYEEYLLIVKRLAEYEGLEEQGKLLKLPCAVGDTVYVIPSIENFGINIVNGHEENNRVYEQIVDHIELRRNGYLLSTCDGMACVIEVFYKETWFIHKEEAEVKLKELERYWQKIYKL